VEISRLRKVLVTIVAGMDTSKRIALNIKLIRGMVMLVVIVVVDIVDVDVVIFRPIIWLLMILVCRISVVLVVSSSS
jgi:hypothetical protein